MTLFKIKDRQPAFSEKSIKGRWGFSGEFGMIASPSVPQPVPTAALGTIVFDGNGGCTIAATVNVNGKIFGPLTSKTCTYSVNPDGTGRVKLNGAMAGIGIGDEDAALISPNSAKVVYTADQDTSGVYELYSVNIDGTGRVKLNGAMTASGDIWDRYWVTPDSTKVVYCAHQETDLVNELYSVNIDGSGRVKIELCDWDGDGDLDLLRSTKNIGWYENVGSNTRPVMRKRGNLCDRPFCGHTDSPATFDWNGDGKLDLLVGVEDGHFYVFDRSYIEHKRLLQARIMSR